MANTLYTDQIIIRLANEAEAGSVSRLATLDSARLPAGPWLVAEVDGEARAALSVKDGSAVADPFYPSAQLVDLMRVRMSSPEPRRERRFVRHSGLRTAYAGR